MADNITIDQVLPEFHAIFEEIYLDEDSDGFEGFDADEEENERDVSDPFAEETWVEGGKSPAVFTFTGNAGPKNLPEPEDGSLSILDFFEIIFTEEILNKIVLETNRYADLYIQGHPELTQYSRLKKWTPVTYGDMKAFIAVAIAMGVVKQINIQDYWSTDNVVSTPFFASVMPRDRFLSIMSFLHLSDNSLAVPRGEDGYTPLQKLGDPYKKLLQRFQDVYNPSQSVAVDEGMIAWRGNLKFRVYSPDKPIKYGIKLYMLCDSKNGYCSQVELYTGRPSEVSQYGVTYDLVMRLAEPYLLKGYNIYMDNYFSSPALFYNLWLNGTLACGTLRSNRRGVPDKLKRAHPPKGQMKSFNNGTVVAIKFSDKKEVCLLTTIHEGKMVNTGKRDADGNMIAKPDCVLGYNNNMGAVDRCDQMVSYAGFDRRTLKWWKKVFFHMVGLAVLNSYILYKERTVNPVLHRIFRRQLVSQLVTAAEISGPQQKGRRRQSPEVLQRLTARHFVGYLPSTGKKAHASRKCVVCGPAEFELFKSQHPGETVPKSCGRMTCFQCKQCQVALCIQPCFELYHTTVEYVLAYKRQRRQQEE